MNRAMKHTTKMMWQLIVLLSLMVMSAMFAPSVFASHSPQDVMMQSDLETDDCLIAGKKPIPRTTIPRPMQPPPPDDKKSAQLDGESQDCLLAGKGPRRPGTSGAGKPRQPPPPKDKPTRLKDTWLPAESQDCLLAGLTRKTTRKAPPKKTLKSSRTKATASHTNRKEGGRLTEESKHLLIAGRGARRPTRRAPPKKTLAAARKKSS